MLPIYYIGPESLKHCRESERSFIELYGIILKTWALIRINYLILITTIRTIISDIIAAAILKGLNYARSVDRRRIKKKIPYLSIIGLLARETRL